MYFDVGGKQVFATTGGKPFDNSKPTVIFLHGSGLDHTFWGLHSRFFAFRNYAVLVPDLPGHTNSEGPALTSIEAMGDWLNDVIEALDANDVSLVAHSQGCLVALEFASRYPDRLRSVSFIASGLATPVNDVLLNAAENDPEAAIAMMLGWGFGSAGHLHQGPIPGNSMVAGGRKVMRGNVPDALATDLKACNNYKNGVGAAEMVSGPIQVIVAGKDRMAPGKATTELIEHLSDPDVTVIARSGHMVPQEVPDQCRALLKAFIFSNNPAT
ncbi:MAG: alpha/beta hydrolase [Gammaproteobacteria bacterium]|jgi:pimeloyl-ACP methyl ester carboxylesterase|nr:alpha/beta hydrolase [Gammaproteobacteria bacterium]MDH3751589.1 alpha/beta hydrolase [Gammaproteobacteria bacterium]